MHPKSFGWAAACLIALCCVLPVQADQAEQRRDARIREVWYDPHTVVTVPVRRGIVTLIALDPGEAIAEVASGLGADCAKPESSWCIAAQPGGQTVFVKPKSTASTANNLLVVTHQRTHAFRLVVLGEGDHAEPVYRLAVKLPQAHWPASAPLQPGTAADLDGPAAVLAPSPAIALAERLTAAPQVVNARYSIAQGKDSGDIVPTLVFDDGRFTYLGFPGNREVPAVFGVREDGAETLVNARMEGELLVADRVGRHLMLRAGHAVVGVWNDAFDIDGRPPKDATTVPGVRRALAKSSAPDTPDGAASNEEEAP